MTSLHTSHARTTAPLVRLPGRRAAVRLAALALVLVAGAACSDDDNGTTAPTPPAVALSLSETSVTLIRSLGETAQVDATVTGASSSDVTWTSANENVATVSATGLITPVADGETFVTARSTADPTKNRSVVVKVVSTIVSVSPTTSFTWVGGPTRQLSSTVTNNPNTAVTWHTSNAAVATVDANGVVTPVGSGSAQITARSVGDATKEASNTFTVDAAPAAQYLLLTSGTPVTVSAATGESKFYRVEVPVGATNLVLQTTGANGDSDIYVRAGAAPTASTFLCRPWLAGSNETCTVANPQSRIYYVWLDAYEGYSNLTLTATITQ